MGKELSELFWVEELLPEGYLRKHMFGGFSYYVNEKLVLLIFESTGSTVHRGKKFGFEIWNGCMFPAEKEHHEKLFSLFPFLISHPILPKWLYLPLETEDFELLAEKVLREIRKENPLLGSIPKSKGSRKSKENVDDRIDTRRPRMFSDEPSEQVLEKAKKISDLKNLGPEAEKSFHKAGIKTPQQFIKLGWQKTMVKLCEANPKNNHSIFAYAVIGALRNRMWNLISEDDKAEAREFMKALRVKAVKKKPTPKKKPGSKKKKATSKKLRSR